MLVLDKKDKTKVNVEMVCMPVDDTTTRALHQKQQAKELGSLIALKYEREARDKVQSKLFFAIGLTISLILVILAFEWKTYDRGELVDLGTINADFDEILEIPPTEQAPPPPPAQKIVAPVIKEVNDEIELKELDITLDMETTEETVIEEVTNFDFGSTEVVEEKADEIFDIVESRPEPVGGMQAFYKYVSDNMDYPSKARRLGISGRVFIQFVVEKDGSLTDVQVIKSLYEDCDAEAVRVIENAPNWIPGKQRGNAVRTYQRVPIMFILREQ